MFSIKESDWKVFGKLRPIALERLCQRILQEVESISADTGKSHHQRYKEIYRHIQEQDREIALGFDHNSRAAAFDQLLFFHSRGLVTEEELSRLSPDLCDRIKNIVLAAKSSE